MNLARTLPVIALLTCAIAPAAAHAGHGDSGVSSGFLHPFTGLDHALAMIAVGVLAARYGGTSRWILPLTFVGAMVIGAGLAGLGLTVPAVDMVIAMSVIALGGMLMMAKTTQIWIAGAVVALVAIPHGYAHMMESTGSVATYTAGMAFGTLALHAVGLGAGLLLARGWSTSSLRAAGVVTACIGALITVGLF